MEDNYDELIQNAEDMELCITALLDLQTGEKLGAAYAQILTQAKEEALSAVFGLMTVTPTDAAMIRELQNKAARYRDLCRWVGNIVIGGRIAEDELPKTREAIVELEQLGEQD